MAAVAAINSVQTVSRLVNIAQVLFGYALLRSGIVLNLAGLADFMVENENSGNKHVIALAGAHVLVEDKESNQTKAPNRGYWRWVVLFGTLQVAWIIWLALIAFGVLG